MLTCGVHTYKHTDTPHTTQQLSHALHRADEGSRSVQYAALEHSAPVFLDSLPAEVHRVPVEL